MKRMILVAMLVVVSILSTGCAKQQPLELQLAETQAPAQTEYVETVAFEIETQKETILPEKTHQIKPKAPSKTVLIPKSTDVEPVEKEEQIQTEPITENNLPSEQPKTILEEPITEMYSAPPTVQENPAPSEVPAPSYSENGWHPTSDTCYHGDGSDSGVCPCCGLIYGPAGGSGEWTGEDGIMG